MKVTKEIISRLQEGNMLAFQSVYESYSAHIYNFIYSLLYNRLEAEDLTQEVFVRIWEKRGSLDIDKNFDSYIFTIARNLVYDEWDSLFHAELYMKSLEADWDERDTPKVEEDITVNSIGQYIDSLIDKLPVSRREIFCLVVKSTYRRRKSHNVCPSPKEPLKPRFTALFSFKEVFGGRRDLALALIFCC